MPIPCLCTACCLVIPGGELLTNRLTMAAIAGEFVVAEACGIFPRGFRGMDVELPRSGDAPSETGHDLVTTRSEDNKVFHPMVPYL